jgi:hypothetical protein
MAAMLLLPRPKRKALAPHRGTRIKFVQQYVFHLQPRR